MGQRLTENRAARSGSGFGNSFRRKIIFLVDSPAVRYLQATIKYQWD
jgi:hypothetical protein